MTNLEENAKKRIYPEKICLLHKGWFDQWKKRVNYDKLTKARTKVTQGSQLTQKVPISQPSGPAPSFFGNWRSTSLLANKGNTLGDRLSQEQEFNMMKQEEQK